MRSKRGKPIHCENTRNKRGRRATDIKPVVSDITQSKNASASVRIGSLAVRAITRSENQTLRYENAILETGINDMSDTSSLLALRDFGGVPEIIPFAIELKQQALALSVPITKVETEQEQSLAVNALTALKAITRGMEATRKAVKAPVLDLGKKIDAVAADFVSDVDREEMRISGMVNHFQRTQLRLKREAEEQIEREKRETQRLADEAERLRKEAEQKPELLPEVVKAEEKAFDAQMANELTAGPLAIAKPKGLVVKSRINFQVENAHVVCQAFPQFWTWHPESETLKLKRREILEELNRADGKGIFNLTTFPEELPNEKDSRIVKPAGMRVFEETRSHVR